MAKKSKPFDFESKFGTDLLIRPFYDPPEGTSYAGHDHLLAQLYSGSYPSSASKPLFAVQIGMFAVDGARGILAPFANEYAMLLGASLNRMTKDQLAIANPKAIPRSERNNWIDIAQSSPMQDNRTESHSTTWGIQAGAELGKTPVASASGSYSATETREIHDMEIYNNEYHGKQAGVCWNFVFTKKDGFNLASFKPRADALFQCSKDKLKSGRFHFVLVERLIYWGWWNEKIDLTIGESAGIGAAGGAVAGGVVNPFALLAAGVGAAIGAVSSALAGAPAMSTADKDKHNENVRKAKAGDSMALMVMAMGAQAEKDEYMQTNAALLCLDFDNNKMVTMGTIKI